MRTTQGPVLVALGLLGAAAALGGTFYVAYKLAQPDDSSSVALWADDSSDRLRVVLGDPQTGWEDLRIVADGPIQFSIDGEMGFASPGRGEPIARQALDVYGGQALQLCAVGVPRTTQITILDGSAVVFQQSLDLQACRF